MYLWIITMHAEIDKYAIEIANKNFPEHNTVRRCARHIKFWKHNKFTKIDLLMGGSPCQGFSFAGEQLAFDDPRSKLFFEFIKL